MKEPLERVLVIGPSCSGKSSFARRLADRLGCSWVQLDELHWGPNWTQRPEAEFRSLAEAAIAGPQWVVDGNYSVLRALLWPRATSVVWLNYGFVTVFLRALRRTIRRVVNREQLFSGNRESFGEAFLSRKSILLWVITTYGQTRRKYEDLRSGPQFAQLRWFEFQRPRDAETFLRELQP